MLHKCTYCQLGFSSKIEVPQLGLAQPGKFQLGLITKLSVYLNVQNANGIKAILIIHVITIS